MNGMRISNRLILAICAMVTSAAPQARADSLRLAAEDSRISGEVLEIGADGKVRVRSPLAAESLTLAAGAVRKIDFTAVETETAAAADAMVELRNGDFIPADVIGLGGSGLEIDSPVIGKRTLSIRNVSSLQLGIRKNPAVYSGPGSLEEWTKAEGCSGRWVFSDGVLAAEEQAVARADLKLPERFIFRFTVSWKSSPNVRVYFADPLTRAETAADRYFVQFDETGFTLSRETTKDVRYRRIMQLQRFPAQYPARELTVEIHVDRPANLLRVLLNDVNEGEYSDQQGRPPSGGGVTFHSQAAGRQEFSDLSVSVLDDSRIRHLKEDRGDGRQDSLISRDDDRWSGKLMEITGSGAEQVFRFKSDFQEAPLAVSAKDVSTVFFQGEKRGDAGAYAMKLAGGGKLAAEACAFDGRKIRVKHPLLGELAIARGMVEGIVWQVRETGKKEVGE